jgi:sugar lactone lactonase YvrE
MTMPSRALALLCALTFAAPAALAQQVSVPIDAAGAGPGAPLHNPAGLDRAPDGSLWVSGASSKNLFRVDAGGAVTEVFSVWPTLTEAGGLGAAPHGAVFASSFSTDSVLRVGPDGGVELAADSSGAGPGQELNGPRELAVDAAGNVFVVGTLSGNVLRIAADGAVTQVLGPAGAGPGAPLTGPRDVAVDGAGVAYVTGMTSDNVLAALPGGGVAQVLGPAGDGAGHPLDGPAAVAAAADGTLYVTSMHAHSVLRRAPGGAVDVVVTAAGDGAGHALSLPNALALAADGTLYVSGLGNDHVFAVSPGGTVTLVASLAGDGSGHLLNDPSDLLAGADGTLYIACAQSEELFTLSGGVLAWLATVPGFGAGVSGNGDGALALDAEGGLLVGGWSNHEVVRLLPGGGTTLVVDDSGGPSAWLSPPSLVRVDPAGRIHLLANDRVFRADGPSAPFEQVIGPQGDGRGHVLEQASDMLFDPQGRLVVASLNDDCVLRLEADDSVALLLGPGGSPATALNIRPIWSTARTARSTSRISPTPTSSRCARTARWTRSSPGTMSIPPARSRPARAGTVSPWTTSAGSTCPTASSASCTASTRTGR